MKLRTSRPAALKAGGKKVVLGASKKKLEEDADPLEPEYGDIPDLEADMSAEMKALKEKMRGADKNFNRLMEDETGCEFYAVAVFPSQDHRDKFFAGLGHRVRRDGVEFCDGLDLAAVCGVPLARPPRRERRYKRGTRFSALVKE